MFQQEIDNLQQDIPKCERVRRLQLLIVRLTVENGEITPTLKVRRNIVEQKFSHLIEKMYEDVT